MKVINFTHFKKVLNICMSSGGRELRREGHLFLIEKLGLGSIIFYWELTGGNRKTLSQRTQR